MQAGHLSHSLTDVKDWYLKVSKLCKVYCETWSMNCVMGTDKESVMVKTHDSRSLTWNWVRFSPDFIEMEWKNNPVTFLFWFSGCWLLRFSSRSSFSSSFWVWGRRSQQFLSRKVSRVFENLKTAVGKVDMGGWKQYIWLKLLITRIKCLLYLSSESTTFQPSYWLQQWLQHRCS